jgi:hypothetical protein
MNRFIIFSHRSLFDLYPSGTNFTYINGTENITLAMANQENPFGTIWDSMLSTYYWNTNDFNVYDDWSIKLFAFFANVILVLVLFNMIIALMK